MAYCTAYGCTTSKRKEECKNKSFFKFPVKTPGLLKAWGKTSCGENSTVSCDFNFVTDVLYEKLKLQDVFPSKDQVIRYMPPPFRMYCKNARIIDDCTEIEVQKPESNGATNDFQSLQKC
ncbi:hypothetical protein TNIN_382511 [Trichonephila inaurata madagascariensis]|uniref:THAP-type domain-containing protein n=1 Tax=Trichonephila inaurata madagascariensis TaxID=2747483 RepID=A0A8X6Y250_9ARAC|nr:hypothetical protein TNIN_382511 [Trichonephila inaurata madagascariensis]